MSQTENRSGNRQDQFAERWHKACVAAKLGTLVVVEGKADPRYTGLIIHDLRRSAIKNVMKAGVNEKVAMRISGHKTRDVFGRYVIVDTEEVVASMRRVIWFPMVKISPHRHSCKQLTP
jgi:hypothetical protein